MRVDLRFIPLWYRLSKKNHSKEVLYVNSTLFFATKQYFTALFPASPTAEQRRKVLKFNTFLIVKRLTNFL
jgi:hypothetical protein